MVDSENPVTDLPHPRVIPSTKLYSRISPYRSHSNFNPSMHLSHPLSLSPPFTMASPIAGPSRLPFNAIRSVARRRLPVCSRFASSTAEEPQADQRTQEAEDAYRSWIQSTGRQYESARIGQRALWLGGAIVRLPLDCPCTC
jgi:hypothetical protein